MWHIRGKAEIHAGFLWENMKINRPLENQASIGGKDSATPARNKMGECGLD
jgi:hypothetical protein